MLGPDLLFLRKQPDPGQPGRVDPENKNKEDPDRGDIWLVCTQCGHPVTTPAQRRERNGDHCHTLFNPHGHVFEIGIFTQAPGALPQGPSNLEFTWFSGCPWQVALCRACGIHLGWRYLEPEGHGFFGLILNRLVEGKGPAGPGG